MAYAALVALGIAPGLRVATRWLYEAMGVSEVPERRPGETDDSFARRSRSWSLRMFTPQTDALASHMLDHHGLYFYSIGAGPSRPGEWEMVDGTGAPSVAKRAIRDVRRTLNTAHGTISAMRSDGLTDAQRQAQDDALAKVAHLRSLMKTKR